MLKLLSFGMTNQPSRGRLIEHQPRSQATPLQSFKTKHHSTHVLFLLKKVRWLGTISFWDRFSRCFWSHSRLEVPYALARSLRALKDPSTWRLLLESRAAEAERKESQREIFVGKSFGQDSFLGFHFVSGSIWAFFAYFCNWVATAKSDGCI